MPTFELPDLGEGLEDAEIIRWLVAEGDTVTIDQEIVEVETSKASVVIPSPFAGVVASLHASEGEVVAVGAPLVSIQPADEPEEPPPAPPSVLVGYGATSGPGRRRRRVVADPPTRPPGIEERRRPPPQLRGAARVMASAMESTLTIPDAAAWLQADASGLYEARRELGSEQITTFGLLLRIVVVALARFPTLNARYTAEGLIVSPAVHLGVATQTDRGLLVPVVENAQELGGLALGQTVAALVQSARDGVLAPAELSGSTFSVSNYGAFGVDGGHPIINPPNVAILGVGRFADRSWVEDGSLGVRPTVELTIAFDHRFNDGSVPSGFLRYLADHVADANAIRQVLNPS